MKFEDNYIIIKLTDDSIYALRKEPTDATGSPLTTEEIVIHDLLEQIRTIKQSVSE